MLPTFVIGLREGLEAALIVGIIAAFLRKQGRRDLLRWVLVGVGAAVALCVAVGVALDAFSHSLPQKQQEGLETVIGVLAVGMVTYMVVWMRRHSRELKGQLEGMAGSALGGASRAGRAMVLMAFLAVIREGFETVVFLLAAFNETGSSASAGVGAVLGIVVAVGLGYGIYRGGVRLNLSRFFRATGLVLVLVAAGLVVNALHTAHEAGWLDVGQGGTVDLSALVRPGTVAASLLTGMLGIQPFPVTIEVVGWLLYLLPVGIYVAWPPRTASSRQGQVRAAVASGVAVALGVGVLGVALAGGATGRDDDDATPAAAGPVTTATTSRVMTVTVTAAHGCLPDATHFRAGGLTVEVANSDATAVSEVEILSGQRIVGEKENVPPGFSGRFAVQVSAGTYTLYCPGATPERRTILVSGTSQAPADQTVAALLRTATGNYAGYVSGQVELLERAVGTLRSAIAAGDLAAARKAYIAARPFYEKIEPVAESFAVGTDSIDADIDARAGDVPAAQWRGFHRIEKGLFADSSVRGLSGYATRLVADVRRLETLTEKLTYQPAQLANGAQELLDEVAASKITGEEERYSHIDLVDVDNNTEGAQQAFAQLQPALARIDPALATIISARFRALDSVIDGYRSTSEVSGFRLYTSLTSTDKRALAAAVKAVQEPLSKVASKVANA